LGDEGRSGDAESDGVRAALAAVDARRGPGVPSLAAADRAAKTARDAFYDACMGSGCDAGAAAVALEAARRARERILDDLSPEDWETLLAAGYRIVDGRESE
jgi:hypothetical protein